jgi:hypothetical protein
MPDMLITSQVARISGLTGEAVRAAARRGDLQSTRAGHVRLFTCRDVKDWIRRRTRQASWQESRGCVAVQRQEVSEATALAALKGRRGARGRVHAHGAA